MTSGSTGQTRKPARLPEASFVMAGGFRQYRIEPFIGVRLRFIAAPALYPNTFQNVTNTSRGTYCPTKTHRPRILDYKAREGYPWRRANEFWIFGIPSAPWLPWDLRGSSRM